MPGDEPFEYMAFLVHSPGWVNRYTTESIENLLSFNAIQYAHQVSPTPLLIVHGRNDKYCLPKFAQQVYDLAENSKEILWLDTTNHIDLYYNEKYVGPAVSKLMEWLNRYLT
jgi:fermentation-respiration switch protein FrsA (DUF1100 family)